MIAGERRTAETVAGSGDGPAATAAGEEGRGGGGEEGGEGEATIVLVFCTVRVCRQHTTRKNRFRMRYSDDRRSHHGHGTNCRDLTL